MGMNRDLFRQLSIILPAVQRNNFDWLAGPEISRISHQGREVRRRTILNYSLLGFER
jgi:hypothetical protein